MELNDLIFIDFDRNQAKLKSKADSSRQVSVSKDVLKEAFITRAWLDQTIMNSVLGKCLLSAEVENGLAKKIWLNLESNQPKMKKAEFKHFGLELNKPATDSEPFSDLKQFEKVADKLGLRFKNTERKDKTIRKGDLIGFPFDNDFIKIIDDRQKRNAAALSPNGLLNCEFTPDWRIVTGMGEASVYETNMTLHHTYGIPFIPASTIKGVLRHYLKEDAGLKNDLIEAIFGDNDESKKTIARGQAIFFDAFPTKAPRIELDVMTPHYPDYYSKGKPPADWQSPNPITFLTVGRGTHFRFLIGLGRLSNEIVSAEKLGEWLEEALMVRGLGAKTAVGYGQFSKKPI